MYVCMHVTPIFHYWLNILDRRFKTLDSCSKSGLNNLISKLELKKR